MASDSTAPRVIDGLVLKATAVTAKRVGVALGKCTAVRSAHGNTSVKRWPKHDALGGPNRPPIVDVPPNRRKTRTPWPFVSIEPPSPTLEPLSTPLTWVNLLRVLSATATQEADPLSPPHRVTQYTPTAIQLRSGAWPHAHTSRVTALTQSWATP